MMGYRDKSYCSDSKECAQPSTKCDRVLSPEEAKRAESIGLPIAWMSFKATCSAFKEKKKP